MQQLFDGEIFPSEIINHARTNPEYCRLNHTISDEIEYFSEILSENNSERFTKLNEMQSSSSGMYGKECFTYGFRLGAMILIEIFSDRNNHAATGSD